jgi:dTDP-4-dehydrorhamnose 3,5-epimerase
MPPEFIHSSQIEDVCTVRFHAYSDERGQFMETFRKSWFPARTWDIVQANRSQSAPGVLRGLHYHHKQVDYWQVLEGTMRVGLADLRPSSPTYRAVETIDLDAAAPCGLYIPVGVAHGFLAQSTATLIYLVDNYYDGGDELGVAWNDPTLAIPWGVVAPIVSERDAQNPRLADIPPHLLPQA